MNQMIFTADSVRGHQKIKRFARRQLILLASHKRLSPQDKLYRKFAYKKRDENNDK